MARRGTPKRMKGKDLKKNIRKLWGAARNTSWELTMPLEGEEVRGNRSKSWETPEKESVKRNFWDYVYV